MAGSRQLPPRARDRTHRPVRTLEGDLRLTDEGASCDFAFRRDFGLFLWGAGITKERASAFGRALQRELSAAPRVATMVWLTGLPQSAPTDDVRAVLSRAIASAPPSYVGLHYVVEAEGFGSAIARSVITGLNLMAKPTLKVEVHQEIAPALASIARQLGWRSGELHAVDRGLSALRADWARRGGTPLPAGAAVAARR